jgi:hypothetical protein
MLNRPYYLVVEARLGAQPDDAGTAYVHAYDAWQALTMSGYTAQSHDVRPFTATATGWVEITEGTSSLPLEGVLKACGRALAATDTVSAWNAADVIVSAVLAYAMEDATGARYVLTHTLGEDGARAVFQVIAVEMFGNLEAMSDACDAAIDLQRDARAAWRTR